MYFLARLEETGLSTWIRESGWVFFSVLTLHSLSLALVVGINVAINLRALGVGLGIPPLKLRGLLPLMRLGLIVVVLSGCLLLLAYPAKALTNPVFYLKLGAIAAALLIAWRLFKGWQNEAAPMPPRRQQGLAGLGLALWLTGIGAGRFLAYTHSILLASSFY